MFVRVFLVFFFFFKQKTAYEMRISDWSSDVCSSDLTRDEITASVHYIHFRLDADQIEAFAAGPVELALTHPAYEHATILGPDTVAELLTDLDRKTVV